MQKACIFNPAGLVFMDKNVDLSAGITGVFANGKFTGDDGYVQKTDNKASTPLYVYAGFKIYDFLAAGIGNIHGKYPANWPGLSFETLAAVKEKSRRYAAGSSRWYRYSGRYDQESHFFRCSED